MNKLILALSVFALLLGSTNAGWGSYQEIANLSKNWSATQQGGGWQYQYFKGNGTRINMTQDCSGTSGSNYQCWKSGETDQTSTSLFPLTYNLSMQVGTGGGESFPNLAYVYYFTSFGNYTLNGSAWGYSGIGNGDGINYTLYLNGVLVCSGPLAINRSQHNFVCDIGKEVVAGSYVEFDIGANSGSGFDYGNFTATVYGVLGEGNINTVTIVSPENNSNNPAIKQTFVFNPSLENDIINASIWYNRTGWTKLADNTSIVVNASLNNLDATFPASGLYTVAVQVCNILDECYFSKNQTLNLTAFIGTVLNTPANNSANTTLLVPFGFTPNSTFSIKNATVYANATGWTALASSSSISNATLNWINTTIPRTGVFIVSIEVCDVNNYCNRSLNTTINLTVARLRIQVLNETTTPTNILFNITISNGTNTTVYPTMTGIWFNKTRNEIPLGDLQITLDNTTFLFRERDYYLQFNYSNTILTAYLLVESLDSEIDLTLKDYAGNLKTGYYLVAQRSFFGTDNYTTVAESRTDYSGIGVMHLLASATYRFAAYDENYNFVQAWEPVLISTLVLIATNTYSKTFI